MTRYVVQRTFPDGLRIPVGNGSELCQTVVERNGEEGVSWVRSNSGATVTADIAAARPATARYATRLVAAKAAGYQNITRMIPDMGFHFLNPKVKGFDVARRRSSSTNSRQRVAARRARVGIHLQARRATASRGAVRNVSSRLPLRGRNVSA